MRQVALEKTNAGPFLIPIVCSLVSCLFALLLCCSGALLLCCSVLPMQVTAVCGRMVKQGKSFLAALLARGLLLQSKKVAGEGSAKPGFGASDAPTTHPLGLPGQPCLPCLPCKPRWTAL